MRKKEKSNLEMHAERELKKRDYLTKMKIMEG
jgi:hypothetical protein